MKAQVSTSSAQSILSTRQLCYAYYELTKPRVVALIVFTAVVGMFLSIEGMIPLSALIFGGLGIGLSAASGAAFNHLLDRRADRVMARTSGRPLPTGSVQTIPAILFAGSLALLSMVLLISQVNLLTAALSFGSMIGYAVVYTVWLKHVTPQNIVIGGAAGAMPPVLGWSAVTGEVGSDALLLFLIIFCWTPPHFWALALYRRDEYAAAGIPMLPVTHGQQHTLLQMVLYTILLLAVSVLPFATGMSGWMYFIGAILLGLGFLGYVVRLYRNYSDTLSRQTFGFSIQYLAMLFGLMLIDHYQFQIIGFIKFIFFA
ncbi:MAG: protoheme IX farnesyltransferase [Proteobacteria bacterium]|jgi:protoheme IX farnesyltransferase|nr:protoheme IX farnesyltransferase [Pseudomonadota bacterium]MDB4825376.1 heme o synthase [Gammaproteobacteria bacterium]MBT4107864.1 protoheme IX farnesyltransferase [Pseudomonadota bacterium]MBT4357338.1 protoheme IX farnesyltransferase [Pseudomonadota bacterium]MBT4987303.1 protoheme IX farnesyltransferase [Pseudomonadota bacterium]